MPDHPPRAPPGPTDGDGGGRSLRSAGARDDGGGGEADDDAGGAAPPPAPPALPLPVPSDPKAAHPPSLHDELMPLFEETVVHPAVIVPARRTAELRRELSRVLMRRAKTKGVYKLGPGEEADGIDPNEERKLVLRLKLEEPVRVGNGDGDGDGDGDGGGEREPTATATTDDVYADPSLRALLRNASSSGEVRRSVHPVALTYEHLTVDRVLRRVLPASIAEVPSSFEVVGRLAHVNLREEALPYRYLVGRTILDKNPGLELVVNKIGNIENEFRTFPMEILARRRRGDDDRRDAAAAADGGEEAPELEVEVREDGSRFRLDFARVYWNSRLGSEHRRLVRLIAGGDVRRKRRARPNKTGGRGGNDVGGDDGDGATGKLPRIVVADAMAGVGPFSVPLASRYRNITCHANDLNPASYRYLKINSGLNRCSADDLRAYNMDGRAFIRKLDDEGIRYDHVIMNLPASAPEFLDAFRGFAFPRGAREGGGDDDDDSDGEVRRPTIHVHCFGPKDAVRAERESAERCERALGCRLDCVEDEVRVRVVRDVSPKKNMLCVSFRLPLGVREVTRLKLGASGEVCGEEEAGRGKGSGGEEDEGGPATKRSRVDSP